LGPALRRNSRRIRDERILPGPAHCKTGIPRPGASPAWDDCRSQICARTGVGDWPSASPPASTPLADGGHSEGVGQAGCRLS